MQSVITASIAVATTALVPTGAPPSAPPPQASVASASGACMPTTNNQSAVLPGTNISVSPMPGTRVAPPGTQISMVGIPSSSISAVTATGSRSGAHPGMLVGYSQGDGVSFVPKTPFVGGENVVVRGTLKTGPHTSEPFQYSFSVAQEDPLPTGGPGHQPAGTASQVQSFRSRPDLRPPSVAVTTRAAGIAPGYVMLAPYSGPGQDGPMIFDNSGQLVWFHPLPSGTEATNVQVQQYRGKPVLTWWQGTIPPEGFGQGEEIITNSAYQQIATVKAGNGLLADLHDFRIAADNTAVLTAFNTIHCNLSSVHGATNGYVTDAVYQQIDLGTGLVRREWHSLDHVRLADSMSSASSVSAAYPFDYFHINTVAPRPDGNLLISARNTWGLYVVDSHSGQVLGTIGGKSSTVKLGPGAAYAFQHDAVPAADGTVSLFDNGAVPKVHPQSRALIEGLNPATSTVTVLRQYVHPSPALSAASQGGVQILPNGDAFVGWGAQPYVSEYSQAGALLFDAHLPPGDQSYRASRFPWTGTPPRGPALVVQNGAHHTRTGYASWNGATEVATWRVLAGASTRLLATLATVPRAGFETSITVPATAVVYELQALSATGAVLGTSPPARAS